MIKIKQIIISWDIWLAFTISLGTTLFLPYRIPINFAYDIYFMGLTILSIVFSIFFASLAIIIASSHDEFVIFLEEEGQFTTLIETFRFTLILLFLALIISIILYTYRSYSKAQGYVDQCKFFFSVFSFMALYALFGVVTATGESITYSNYRSRFLSLKRDAGNL